MAKPGRPPKIATMSCLPESLVEQIDLAILSDADESATSIYTRFGLAQRGIGKSSFDKYVGRMRKEKSDRRYIENPPPPAGDAPTWEELDRMARVEALRALSAGSSKLYELMLVTRGKREVEKLDIERMTEARAGELHAVKMASLRATMKKDVDARTSEGETLTREDVYDLIDQAMRS